MTDFQTIFQDYRPKIHRYLANLCGEADAQDLTQTVFLKVSNALDNFRGESSLATWIYRIATNTAHDHATSALTRQQHNELQLDENLSADDFADADLPGTDEEYIRREMNACIRNIVAQLPEAYRTILILRDFEELSNAEIADVMGIGIDTAKTRLHRGRNFLRKELECQCSFYHDDRNQLMCDRKN